MSVLLFLGIEIAKSFVTTKKGMTMYLLTAIFNHSCLNDVLLDLKEKGIEGITISHVLGKGGLGYKKENGDTELDKNVRLDIVLSSSEYKEAAKEAIRSNTRDLVTGSGKMWVTPVLEVERIRTGETNEEALAHPKIEKKKNIIIVKQKVKKMGLHVRKFLFLFLFVLLTCDSSQNCHIDCSVGTC